MFVKNMRKSSSMRLTLSGLIFASLMHLAASIHLAWAQLQCTEETKDPLLFYPHANDPNWMYLANFNTVLTLRLFDRSRREHVPSPLSYQDTE